MIAPYRTAVIARLSEVPVPEYGLVLDPTGVPLRVADGGEGPAVGELTGKVVGLRRDRAWQSWVWVADEWEARLRAAGARLDSYTADTFVGKEAATNDAALDAFVERVDAAVMGLCNCGSCTLYTVRAAIRSVERGRPTAIVTTEQFVDLARTIATLEGHGEIPLVVLPFPLETRPEDEVRDIARVHYDRLLDAIGATGRA
jgi:hypothetical protein